MQQAAIDALNDALNRIKEDQKARVRAAFGKLPKRDQAFHQECGELIEILEERLEKTIAARAPARKTPTRRKKPAPKRRQGLKRGKFEPLPDVAPGMFRGMGTTDAYSAFVERFGEDHPVARIRDSLWHGGADASSTSSMLTGLHAIRRRQRIKREKAEEEAAAAEAAVAGAGDAPSSAVEEQTDATDEASGGDADAL